MFVSIPPPATWIYHMSAKSKEMYVLVIWLTVCSIPTLEGDTRFLKLDYEL